MANNFFKNGDKAYSENLNDSVLVGNAFDWTVNVSLPSDTGSTFPNSSSVVKAKVCDVSITPNSNLSIGSTISNSSGSSQVYRLTVYPNFNRFGGFKSITLTAGSGVTFYIANKGASTPIANNLDYTNLGNVPELKVLKEYDIVVTVPTGKSVTGLSFVLQSSSADVSGSIAQSNVTGLQSSLDGKANSSHAHGNLTTDGKVGSNANYFVYTTTGGAVTSKQKIGNITTDGKVGSSANYFVYTTTGGTVTSKQKIGNITTDGKIGSSTGKIVTTGTDGVLQASDNVGSATEITLTNGKLYVNEATRTAELHYSNSRTFTSGDVGVWTFIETISQITSYPPKATLYAQCSVPNVLGRLFDTGSVQAYSTSQGAFAIAFNLIWQY